MWMCWSCYTNTVVERKNLSPCLILSLAPSNDLPVFFRLGLRNRCFILLSDSLKGGALMTVCVRGEKEDLDPRKWWIYPSMGRA